MADIWASNEEILFEGGGLEGASMSGSNQNRTSSTYIKKRKKDQNVQDRYDPLCPNDEGYGEYRSKEQIKRSTLNQKDKRKRQRQDNNGAALNGEEAQSTKSCDWHYIDQSGTLQGPFTSGQMIGWKDAGFFPMDTMVRNGDQGEFIEMGSVDLSTGILIVSKMPFSESGLSGSVDDRIAALKDDMAERPVESIDDRIAALKSGMTERPDESVDDRIAALKHDMMESPDESVDDRIAALKNGMTERPDESVDERIAALKNDMAERPVEGVDDRIAVLKNSVTERPVESVNDRIAALKNGMTESPVESPDDRIAALKNEVSGQDKEGVINEELPAYPILDDEQNMHTHRIYNNKGDDVHAKSQAIEDSDVATYSVHEGGEVEPIAYPEVSAYPVDEIPVAYPTQDVGDSEDQTYPEVSTYPAYESGVNTASHSQDVGDHEAPAYPEVSAHPADEGSDVVFNQEDDENGDVPYPSDVAYPIDGEYDYPDTDAAYGASATSGEEYAPYYVPKAETNTNSGAAQKKAVFKGDKAVVGFVPSNLHIRRNMKVKTIRRKQLKKKPDLGAANVKPAVAVNAITDDYEKFMSEVNSLK